MILITNEIYPTMKCVSRCVRATIVEISERVVKNRVEQSSDQ